MRPPAVRRPLVPSTGLLLFLRHQSEALFAPATSVATGQNLSPESRRGGKKKTEKTTEKTAMACARGMVSPAVWPSSRRCIVSLSAASHPPWSAATALLPTRPSSKAAFCTSQPLSTWWERRAIERQHQQTQKLQQHQQHQQRQAKRRASLHELQSRLWAVMGGSHSKNKRSAYRGRGPGGGGGVGVGGIGGISGIGGIGGIGGMGTSAALFPGNMPDGDAGPEFASIMFNARRLQTAKAALEPRLRCTEIDEDGQVIMVDGEFKKTELIAKYGLLPRDLRKIDSSNLPHILVRPAAILLNLLHLKVLIKADRVLLFDVYGSKTSYPQSAFLYDLQERLQQPSPASSAAASAASSLASSLASRSARSSSLSSSSSPPPSSSSSPPPSSSPFSSSPHNGLPYEFRALEAVLLSVTSELEAEFDTVREPVIGVLGELESDITREKLRLLLVLSKKVSAFEQKAQLVRDAIAELLEADDDLAAMYLTEKKQGIGRGVDDHTEVEMLLESYHKICDEVAQEAASLVTSIRNTEEIMRAILDANRNALMLLDLKFSIGTLGLAMGTFLAGLYGMNLENFIEETTWGFAGITSMSCAFSLVVCWYGLVKLRKVQRVKMHGSNAYAGYGGYCGYGYGSGYPLPGPATGAAPVLGPFSAASSSGSGFGSASASATSAASSANAGYLGHGSAFSTPPPGGLGAGYAGGHSPEHLRRLGMFRDALMYKKYY